MLSENGPLRVSKRTPMTSSDFFHSSSYSRLIVAIAVRPLLVAEIVEQLIRKHGIVSKEAAIGRVVTHHAGRNRGLVGERLALADDVDLLLDVVREDERPA